MAGAQTIQFAGPSYWLADQKTAVQRSVNCYPMLVEGLGEAAQLVLESAPGLELVADLGTSIRGMYNADGRMFLVAGTVLKEMSTAEAFTDLGTLASSSGFVAMVNGTGQLAMTDTSTLYVLNTDANTLATVSSAGWRGSASVDFLDGYFLFAAPDTEQPYISAIDDAGSLDPLDFSSADRQPDKLVRPFVRGDVVYMMGQRTIEPWVNSGGADFPFVRFQGTPIEVGLVGHRAVCAAAGSMVWVGQSKKGGPYVYTLNGLQEQRISTQAVEQQLAASTDIGAATLWSYQEAGGEFVSLLAPGMQTTWVWDAATRQWCERGEWVDGAWTPSRTEHHAYFNNVHYVAGGSKLYRMSRNYKDLAGDVLMRERTWPHLVSPLLDPATYRSLELRCTTGGQGAMTLEVSNDGGAVFGAPLRRSLGETGQRAHRVRWGPLGTCPAGGSRVYRLRCSDPVSLTMQGAVIA